ncbi:MAG: ORF6N domain-containing protein, partial [Eubacterium sp.]|nr:ORF6N domain-containing protein [Eubacterium sp.]
MAENETMEIAIVSEEEIRNKIFEIRGQKAMLDEDLALIYGYTTKAFNQQVKNNIAKFDEDFRFQLTDEEVEELSRSKILTSMQVKGTKGGRTSNPYIFTESGIYMLMTVLRGDLAVRQSKALIRLFKGMKDYLVESPAAIGQEELLRLSLQTAENTNDIRHIKEEMATKSDLEKFLKNFTDNHIGKEFLLMDGKTIEAEVAYGDIYKLAKKSIFIVDNYIGVKTLLLLKDVPSNVSVTIFSDNKVKLTLLQYQEFCKEYPNVKIQLQKTCDKFHDRFIIIDYGTKDEKIYHCGGSSKDGGKRTTVLSRLEDINIYDDMIKELLKNP